MSGYELALALRSAPHRFAGLLVALTSYGEKTIWHTHRDLVSTRT